MHQNRTQKDTIIGSIYVIIGALFAYLEISQEAFLLLTFLLVIDTLLGMIKSVVVAGLEFSSMKLKVGLLGKMAVLFVPFSLALIAKIVGLQVGSRISAVVGFLAVAEGISIIQNVIMIRTKKIMTEFDAITFVLRGILDHLKKMLEKGFTHKNK